MFKFFKLRHVSKRTDVRCTTRSGVTLLQNLSPKKGLQDAAKHTRQTNNYDSCLPFAGRNAIPFCTQRRKKDRHERNACSLFFFASAVKNEQTSKAKQAVACSLFAALLIPHKRLLDLAKHTSRINNFDSCLSIAGEYATSHGIATANIHSIFLTPTNLSVFSSRFP